MRTCIYVAGRGAGERRGDYFLMCYKSSHNFGSEWPNNNQKKLPGLTQVFG